MASKLPVISGKEAVKAFEKAGWKFGNSSPTLQSANTLSGF